MLAGVSVTSNGTEAPLFYVSPGQINAQVPLAASSAQSASVVVKTASGTSNPATVEIAGESLGLFTTDASGCGPGAVYNLAQDGSLSLNSPANSVEPGGIVVAWATGLTTVYSFPADGVPAPSNPPTKSYMQLGFYKYDHPGGVLWAGKAPLQVGVDQFNLSLRSDIEGCSVPVRVEGWSSISQPVPVSIHRGGGAATRTAWLKWRCTRLPVEGAAVSGQ
jgi:uncharacterized protein (TIGR03437 family)